MALLNLPPLLPNPPGYAATGKGSPTTLGAHVASTPCPGAPPSCPTGSRADCQSGTWRCIPWVGGPGNPGSAPRPETQCPDGTSRVYDPATGQYRCDNDPTGDEGRPNPVTPAAPTPGDCPPGMHWNPNARECRPGAASGAGSGAGVGGGGGGGGTPPVHTGGDVSDLILAELKKALESGGPFTEDVMNASKAKLFQATEGRRRAGESNLNDDLIRRNIYRSGIAARGQLDLTNTASGEYTGGVSDLMVKGTLANYQAKMDTLTKMQTWLDSLRQFYLGNKQIEAQIKLGMAKIAAEKEMLQMQLDARGGGGGGQQGDPFLDFLDIYNRIYGAPPPTTR